MSAKRKETPVTSKTVAPCGVRPLKGQRDSGNLPPVSRQTAGGIAGAALGGLVAGPLGSVVAGVAGALVGDASAAGDRPVMRAVESIRAVAEPPARRAYKSITDAIARHRVSSRKKTATKKAATQKADAKEAVAKKKADAKEAETKKKTAAQEAAAKKSVSKKTSKTKK